MHPKAEQEFDHLAGAFLDEVATLALAAVVALAFGWFVASWLASR